MSIRTRRALLALLYALLAAAAAGAQALYWEPPLLKASAGVSYSSAAADGDLLVLAWQEVAGSDASAALTVYADVARLDQEGADTAWTGRRPVYGPISLAGIAGEAPRMYSLAVTDDRILFALVLPDVTGSGGSTILVTSSIDGGASFREIARFAAGSVVSSPDLSRTADGGWLLLLRQAEEQGRFSIAFTTSGDGGTWSTIAPLVTDPSLTQNIQPHHAVFGGRDYVAFQSRVGANDQVYLKISADGGRTWNAQSIPVTTGTGFAEALGGQARTPDAISNRRPVLAPRGDRLALAWERAPAGSAVYQVYYCELDAAGAVVLPREPVTRGEGALYPEFLATAGVLRLLYTEQQARKARLVVATRRAGTPVATWEAVAPASAPDTSALVPQGAVLRDRVYAFAEAITTRGTWALYAIRPDTTTMAPALRPVDFTPNVPANRDRVGVRWDEPPDASRIAGYRTTWSLAGRAASTVEVTGGTQSLVLDAPEDGEWTLSVWSIDRAGNVSRSPARITFRRDATPPAAATLLLEPPPDLDGFQPSNDFSLTYVAPAGDTIARYEVTRVLPAPGGSVEYLAQGLRARNVNNGEYTVTVRAVDVAGNVGAPAAMTVRLDRYVAVTRVRGVDQSVNDAGGLDLRIVGVGFALGGEVTEVYVDRDGREPWDIVFSRAERQYEVRDDLTITGVMLGAENDSGTYRVAVRHPRRGLSAFSAAVVEFSAPGTVKIGDYRFRWLPRWASARTSRLHVPFVALLVVLAAGLLAVLFVFSTRRVVAVSREGALLEGEVRALLEGRPSPLAIEETDRRLRAIGRRGLGLRVKFSFLVSVLAAVIVAVLAVPLGLQMISRERGILAEDLRGRADLLLDGAAARAAAPLRAGTSALATIAGIPASVDAFSDEFPYLTISGPADPVSADPADRDWLWASNDPRWPASSFVAGRRRIVDDELPDDRVAAIATDLNAEATAALHDIAEMIPQLAGRVNELAARAAESKSPADLAAAKAAQDQVNELRDEARRRILAVAKAAGRSGSFPAFDPARLRSSYLFYRPIADYVADGSYFLGMVRLGVSTDVISVAIRDATRELVRTIAVVAIAAIGLGVVGAIVLASITIRPVRVLAAGVAKIRDTPAEKHEEELAGFEITLKARDETGALAEAVNEMTRGLVQAAKDKKELLVGKSLQKQFIPLEVGPDGEKGSMAAKRTPAVEMCGYYEGAKGVSGDYFDFQPLDERRYALINCDVSGKGVPAAMIMFEVATLFLGWCNDARTVRGGAAGARGGAAGLDDLVYLINDMLEERGFKGKFAALTVGVLDTATGALEVCTAGNNVLHVYSSRAGAMVQQALPQPPAAGVFPSDMVRMKSGFPPVRLSLDHGDAVFLFTDGFEEAKRSFRNHFGDEVACREPGVPEGGLHGVTHSRGQVSEEFGIPRITAIVNAVFSHGRYVLERCHTVTRETLEFDFSSCVGSVEDAVLALVAIEKVFRLYRDARTGPSDRVEVDPNVDAFLRKHFRQFDRWFTTIAGDAKPGQPITYAGLKEDPQYDDLTLLVVRRT